MTAELSAIKERDPEQTEGRDYEPQSCKGVGLEWSIGIEAAGLGKSLAKLYVLEVSELCDTDKPLELANKAIPVEYQDMEGVFSEEASNELSEHGVSDMKIEIKED